MFFCSSLLNAHWPFDLSFLQRFGSNILEKSLGLLFSGIKKSLTMIWDENQSPCSYYNNALPVFWRVGCGGRAKATHDGNQQSLRTNANRACDYVHNGAGLFFNNKPPQSYKWCLMKPHFAAVFCQLHFMSNGYRMERRKYMSIAARPYCDEPTLWLDGPTDLIAGFQLSAKWKRGAYSGSKRCHFFFSPPTGFD